MLCASYATNSKQATIQSAKTTITYRAGTDAVDGYDTAVA